MDLADDLLKDHLRRQHAGRAAVFVHDDGQLRMAALHELQHLADLHRFRHVQHRPDQLADIMVASRIRRQQVGDMDEPDDLILVLETDGIARMFGAVDDVQVVPEGLVGEQAIHIRPGQHDLAGHHVGEIENVVDELHFVGIDDSALGALVDEQADLLLGMGRLMLAGRSDAEQLQQAVGRSVQHDDRRLEHLVEEHERSGQPEGYALRLLDGQRLGSELAEHDMQEGDDQEPDDQGHRRNDRFARDSELEQQRLHDHMRYGRLADPAQSKRSQRNAELGRQGGRPGHPDRRDRGAAERSVRRRASRADGAIFRPGRRQGDGGQDDGLHRSDQGRRRLYRRRRGVHHRRSSCRTRLACAVGPQAGFAHCRRRRQHQRVQGLRDRHRIRGRCAARLAGA
ncbi:hypothetical protein BN871_DT_00100 [Paenibacillus sp. P22]|nr:hypothetical protein BN871_DT_00100 [Paenibacillus sp. P22]